MQGHFLTKQSYIRKTEKPRNVVSGSRLDVQLQLENDIHILKVSRKYFPGTNF